MLLNKTDILHLAHYTTGHHLGSCWNHRHWIFFPSRFLIKMFLYNWETRKTEDQLFTKSTIVNLTLYGCFELYGRVFCPRSPEETSNKTGILTGQGDLASSESLRSGALEGERDRKRTYRNPRGVGWDENQESRPKQATTHTRWNRKSGGGGGEWGVKVTEARRL